MNDVSDALYSFEKKTMEILKILRNHIINNKTSFSPDVEEFSTILDVIEKQLNSELECQKNELHYDQYIARCIDLEGLDGCGKSTLANELHHELGIRGQKSRLLYSPPSELHPFRPYFDAQQESIRRTFYNLGNLIVSFELKNQKDMVTILDRYWPSTIAYQLAKTDQDNLTNILWPNYLVQPALIAYIYVDEAERCRRIAQRSIPVTLEEKQLAEQVEFRRRLDFIYRNKIPSTRLHAIDGNRPTSIIANEILNLLQE